MRVIRVGVAKRADKKTTLRATSNTARKMYALFCLVLAALPAVLLAQDLNCTALGFGDVVPVSGKDRPSVVMAKPASGRPL